MGEHIWTEGEKANMKAYWDSNPKPRKNLMKLVRHILGRGILSGREGYENQI